MTVQLQDDGLTIGGGSDISDPLALQLVVPGTYAAVNFSVDPGQIDAAFEALVYSELGALVSGFPVVISRADGDDVGLNPPDDDIWVTPATSTFYVMLGDEEHAVNFLRSICSPSQMNSSNSSNSSVASSASSQINGTVCSTDYFVSAGLALATIELHSVDVNRTEVFTVPDPVLVLNESSTNIGDLVGFVTEISPAKDELLGYDGNLVLGFVITPMRYRLFGDVEWTSDGTDGGVFAPLPAITPECSVFGPCPTASLSLVDLVLAYNGDVDFLLSLTGTNTTANVTITIPAWNDPPIFVLPAAYYILEANESMVFRASALISNARPGPPVRDELAQLFSFTVADVPQLNSSVVELVNTTGDVIFNLLPYRNGNITLAVSAEDNGMEAYGSNTTTQYLTLVLTPVNRHPFYEIDCASTPDFLACGSQCFGQNIAECEALLVLAQDCEDCTSGDTSFLSCPNAQFGPSIPYAVYGFATSIMPSFVPKPDEDDELHQNITFSLQLVSGNAGGVLFTIDPQIDTAGTLYFCMERQRVGNATFAVTLQDNGGTENGGVDVYGPATLQIEVREFNQLPQFDLCCDGDVVVWRGSGSVAVP
eukprot:2601207-Rhodomonas_salina.1